MATDVENRQFVDSVIRDILQPGAEQLMEGRYFTALREGTLSIRQLQGFALHKLPTVLPDAEYRAKTFAIQRYP